MMKQKLSICYFGSFLPNFSRNRVLIKGLRENGCVLFICNDTGSGLGHYINLVISFLKMQKCFDAMVVGAVCQYDMPFAWLLAKVFRKKLVFDIFISLYDTYVNDRKMFNEGSFSAKKIFWWDKLSCILADVIIIDTKAHAKYLIELLSLPEEKVRVVNVGVDEEIYQYSHQANKNKFMVHFHGSYQPLQGIELIIKAAEILKGERDILFRLIGDGFEKQRIEKIIKNKKLKNIELVGMVSYEELAEYIKKSDICLGIFGGSKKAGRVIPNKAVEAISLGKPFITIRSKALEERFVDGESVLMLEKRDPEILARLILKLKTNRRLYRKLSIGGYKIFKKHFTHKMVGREFKRVILGVV